MKKMTSIILLGATLISSPLYADVKLQDNSKILGKWQVNAEALGLDREKTKLHVTWEFLKDGTLKTLSDDIRTAEMDIPIKYSVENGVIKKQSTPGREKYEDCAVVELKDNEMTLKCKFLYFFLTRK